MTGLAFARSPPARRPLRFLLTSPAWGILAGLALIIEPDALTAGRWSPASVALVHAFTLGVLGNAMLGSLHQFLPVAMGTPVPGGRWASLQHLALNLGLGTLVVGLLRSPSLLWVASTLLALALLGIALPLMPMLLRNGAQRLERAGIAASLLALAATVGLGVLAVAVLTGRSGWPLDRVVDAHALAGVGGWILVLLAMVGGITLPMLQGTAPVPARTLQAWLAMALVLWVGAAIARLMGAPPLVPALALAVATSGFAAGVLCLQWRRPHRRNRCLVVAWRAGTVAVAIASLLNCAAALDAGDRTTLVAATLGIGIGLPLLVNAMLVEIVPFITWVALREACPRGVRIPGVGGLSPDRDKWIGLGLHALAGLVLLAAQGVPRLAPVAGTLLAVAYACTFATLLRVPWRACAFARNLGTPKDAGRRVA